MNKTSQAVPVAHIRRDALIHKCNAMRLEICLERSNALLLRVAKGWLKDDTLPVVLLEDILKELQSQDVIVEVL